MTVEIAPDAMAAAMGNFGFLYRKLVGLYTGDGTGLLSHAEATQLAESLSYVLRIDDPSCPEALLELAGEDPEALFARRQAELAGRVDDALGTWRSVCLTMPPLHNVSLRDTLESIGRIKTSYDTYFSAHEVPCDNIQYQLGAPVDESLRGIDYLQAWLDRLLFESRWIARFTLESCVAVLERDCPDYKGLHVNLYGLLERSEADLRRVAG